jgi:hypothetical protein
MTMTLGGAVGPAVAGSGPGPVPVRLGNQTEVMVSELNGRYYEQTFRGNEFTFSSTLAGITIAAGMISPVGAAATVFLALANPVSSPVNLVIVRAKIWTVSGTPGGPFGWNVIAPNSGLTAAGVKGINNKTFIQGGNGVGFANAAMTGALAATMFRGIGGQAAIAAGAGNYHVEEETAGDIIVLPGGAVLIAPTAAGTTHIAGASITYVETPPNA